MCSAPRYFRCVAIQLLSAATEPQPTVPLRVRERWSLENVSVVAFVSDNNNIVQQVVKVPVKLTSDEPEAPAE